MRKNVLLAMLICLSAFIYSCTEDNKPTFTRAGIISEEFVKDKMKFPEEVDFSQDRRGSETSPNEYDVFQKFTAKNAFGVKCSYIYKINMVYKAGDWTEQTSWTYKELTIENISTGEQNKFYAGE